jgi:hypothetical protein
MRRIPKSGLVRFQGGRSPVRGVHESGGGPAHLTVEMPIIPCERGPRWHGEERTKAVKTRRASSCSDRAANRPPRGTGRSTRCPCRIPCTPIARQASQRKNRFWEFERTDGI